MEETQKSMEKEIEKEERVFTQQEVEGIVARVNMQARAQCENIAKRCQVLEEQLMYRKLDYLFKVIENINSFSMEFVQKCIDEIESTFTPPEVEAETETEQETETKE